MGSTGDARGRVPPQGPWYNGHPDVTISTLSNRRDRPGPRAGRHRFRQGADRSRAVDYRAPRTPDGQPDISGIWTNDTLTPLERPAELGDKAFYTAEEAAAVERQGTGARDRDNAPGRKPTAAGGSLDRGYNFFWFDPRDHIVPTHRTSMVADPPSGRVPTRPAAEERAAWLVANRTDSYLNMSPYSRCITRGVPGSMLPNSYNTGNHIFQVPGYVIIVYEMVREPRIIPLDGRPHVDPRIRQWMGDARGRWEGETLVVETTHFTERGLDHPEPERRPHARRPRQPRR